MDLSTTTEPRSDQQNYDDVAQAPRIVTVTEVKEGTSEQPVEIHLAEYPGRPYKPSKSMRRVLVAAWGNEGSAYPGRRIKLVGDPTVRFGRDVVGGIKIGALSHLDKPLTMKLTVSKGRREDYTVQPLADAPPTKDWAAIVATASTREQLVAIRKEAAAAGMTPAQIDPLLTARAAEFAGEQP